MPFFTRIDPAKNIHRFWRSVVTPTLLGGFSLLREYGRIGSPGTVQIRTFDREQDAQRAEQRGIRRRELHGYEPTQDVVVKWSLVMSAGGSIQTARKRVRIKSKRREYLANDNQGVLDFPNTSKNLS